MSNANNLLNINNYNLELDSKQNILTEYHKVLNEYLSHAVNQLVIKDSIHYLFILHRGFDLLKNIFITLLHYTKNLELTIHHLRKSYLYYTEFIGQVGEDSNSFLQLNSKDACLFVYKKTIYDINEEYKKKLILTKKEKIIFLNIKENIFIFTNILKIICSKYIKPTNRFLEKNNSNIKEIKLCMNKILNELKKNNFKTEQEFNKIYVFVNYLDNDDFELEYVQQLVCYFFKKINSCKLNKLHMCKLLLEKDKNSILTPTKFINKLFRK